ncbi:segregation and condensation protein B [Pedobacter psychrotolerans]|uniref:Segregation and condensation protein B n=1 Tax=Pedobacter psychrotolerans TaxID=1843235 RepID=A0A4R2HC41_9SPHI|nr:SMC-Scp complex subunit ScpB [Pedobacter psychrotolerans]TCO25137.1 segregation and condensation protein B [Pedobacter psychrotolerans]GGE47855.1 segregation and condensation protein B [Pedobacter psychrotolerans]
MPQQDITRHIEALIFSSIQSISVEEIILALNAVFEEEIVESQIFESLDLIAAKYSKDDFAIELVNLNKGYQFLTKKDYHETVNQLQLHRSKKKLSQAAMETLAIIAYRQPITKLEIEQIRGVNSDYSVQRLLEKELISIEGKAETPGRPILYRTSPLFMDYFGLNHLNQLPQLKDITKEENTIGENTA